MERFREAVFARAIAISKNKCLSEERRKLIEDHLRSISTVILRTPTHLPYAEMIQSAIRSLNEEGGSSEASISKYIEANYNGLPWAHSHILPFHLARLTKAGEIVESSGSRYSLFEPGQNPNSHPPKRRRKTNCNYRDFEEEKEGTEGDEEEDCKQKMRHPKQHRCRSRCSSDVVNGAKVRQRRQAAVVMEEEALQKQQPTRHSMRRRSERQAQEQERVGSELMPLCLDGDDEGPVNPPSEPPTGVMQEWPSKQQQQQQWTTRRGRSAKKRRLETETPPKEQAEINPIPSSSGIVDEHGSEPLQQRQEGKGEIESCATVDADVMVMIEEPPSQVQEQLQQPKLNHNDHGMSFVEGTESMRSCPVAPDDHGLTVLSNNCNRALVEEKRPVIEEEELILQEQTPERNVNGNGGLMNWSIWPQTALIEQKVPSQQQQRKRGRPPRKQLPRQQQQLLQEKAEKNKAVESCDVTTDDHGLMILCSKSSSVIEEKGPSSREKGQGEETPEPGDIKLMPSCSGDNDNHDLVASLGRASIAVMEEKGPSQQQQKPRGRGRRYKKTVPRGRGRDHKKAMCRQQYQLQTKHEENSEIVMFSVTDDDYGMAFIEEQLSVVDVETPLLEQEQQQSKHNLVDDHGLMDPLSGPSLSVMEEEPKLQYLQLEVGNKEIEPCEFTADDHDWMVLGSKSITSMIKEVPSLIEKELTLQEQEQQVKPHLRDNDCLLMDQPGSQPMALIEEQETSDHQQSWRIRDIEHQEHLQGQQAECYDAGNGLMDQPTGPPTTVIRDKEPSQNQPLRQQGRYPKKFYGHKCLKEDRHDDNELMNRPNGPPVTIVEEEPSQNQPLRQQGRYPKKVYRRKNLQENGGGTEAMQLYAATVDYGLMVLPGKCISTKKQFYRQKQQLQEKDGGTEAMQPCADTTADNGLMVLPSTSVSTDSEIKKMPSVVEEKQMFPLEQEQQEQHTSLKQEQQHQQPKRRGRPPKPKYTRPVLMVKYPDQGRSPKPKPEAPVSEQQKLQQQEVEVRSETLQSHVVTGENGLMLLEKELPSQELDQPSPSLEEEKQHQQPKRRGRPPKPKPSKLVIEMKYPVQDKPPSPSQTQVLNVKRPGQGRPPKAKVNNS
ncbi:PREDICTED: titin-like [Nelumbo nucifera]|uniref:Titin-like n=2 Tax=Nelumbo nucifera TaxID=4432 RepID=A0A1U8B5H2_NELNU|nr:PREDICTED: titin-like [Nelumbo nucifera]XP_010274689.1 PREDICTED: titin-like [Nelumbo nucifera]XP_010274690.1 PREDICTED: titin-like [Nelumbo nucifera]XP_010274691.1 PREDICTED: titin-like [Nelumbo nucifera]DAD32065.1 TPA_asm: hypothetical protein HUJ06_010916 [Nelumbo nucifera]